MWLVAEIALAACSGVADWLAVVTALVDRTERLRVSADSLRRLASSASYQSCRSTCNFDLDA